ncbi:MAG: 50S ribosomal protein L22 [Candidatus Zixiibacteriota bacterium]|nr:MAG: 50S ribosomal protein L22 [candidate division Zixibacteria bacterium]
MAQEETQRPVRNKLLAQIQALDEADEKKVIRTRARRSRIRPEFVGHTFAVFNGQGFTNLKITQELVGKTLAKAVPKETPTARSMFLSIPQRKMRQVAQLVIGLRVEKALDILNFTPKIAAEHIARTLKSAVANKLSVEGTSQLNPEDLSVKRITVDAAPTAKRIRFQSMGRVFRYRKRFCHLSIYLEEKPVQGESAVLSKVKDAVDGAEKAKTTKKKTKSKKTASPKMTKASKKSAQSGVSSRKAGSKADKTAGGGKQGSQRGR